MPKLSRIVDFVTGREYREAAAHHRNRIILMGFRETRIISAEQGPFKEDCVEDAIARDNRSYKISYGERTQLAQAVLCVADDLDYRQARADLEQEIGESPDLSQSAVNTVLYFVPTHQSTMATRDHKDRRRYGILISGRTNEKRLEAARKKAASLLAGVCSKLVKLYPTYVTSEILEQVSQYFTSDSLLEPTIGWRLLREDIEVPLTG